jgi:DNA-binding NarL/FixJ family response regulator
LINLLIYEDDQDLGEGLRHFLNATQEFNVEACYNNCDTIQADLKQSGAEIILMDIDMPGTSGIDGVRIAKVVKPGIIVLMFTVFDDDKKIFDAICAGADGYLLKKTTPEKIIEALKDAYHGGAPMTPSIAKKVLNFFPKPITSDSELLTEKEREVLQHLVNGKSYKQVATAMKVTIETVRSHIKNIYRKLHVNSMSQAVAKAINQKLI